MSIEAMKQALQAMEKHGTFYLRHEYDYKKAITALRQAIAGAEKQEPVAWFIQYEYRHEFLWREPTAYEKNSALEIKPLYTAPVHASDISQERVDETAKCGHDWVEMQCPCGHKMYVKHTGREWVGLTDEEREQVRSSAGYNQFMSAGEYAKAVQLTTEAKLKEKNA